MSLRDPLARAGRCSPKDVFLTAPVQGRSVFISMRVEAKVAGVSDALRGAIGIATSARTPHVCCDPSGECVFVNDRWRAMTGRDFEDARCFGWLNAVHRDDVEVSRADWRAYISDPAAEYAPELRFVHRSTRKTSWMRAHSVTLEHAGRIAGFFVNFTDVTDLLRARQASDERYELAVAASQDGVWDWRIPEDSLVWSNRLMEIAGVEPAQFAGKFSDFSSRVHPRDLECVMKALHQHLECRAEFVVRLRLRHETGQWRWIRMRGQATWDAHGRPIRMLGSASDVTATVTAERANERLREAHREMERFTSAASQDMKAHLRKMQTFCDRIRGRSGVTNARTIECLERMGRSAKHMGGMVDELLQISRVPNEACRRTVVDMNKVVQRVVQMLAPRINDAQAVVSVDDLPRIEANETQAQLIVHNLVDNAIKYRADDRSPLISISARTASRSDFVAIEVSDNGIGFEPHYADRIFEPFERVHGDGARNGVGLGLTLCRRIVDQHGGLIEARSTPALGSAFVFELPKAPRGSHLRLL